MVLFNRNMEARNDIADALENAKLQIEEALTKARYYVQNNLPSEYDHADAYIFRAIEEHCDNVNPYNQSLQKFVDRLRGEGMDDEPLEDLGETWEEELCG